MTYWDVEIKIYIYFYESQFLHSTRNQPIVFINSFVLFYSFSIFFVLLNIHIEFILISVSVINCNTLSTTYFK